MRAAWLMFAVFVVALGAFHLSGINTPDAIPIAARLVILYCFAAGLGWTLYERRDVLAARHSPPTAEQVRLKSLSIRIGLVALLLYPALMAALFSHWPTAVFNFEYLLALPILLLAVPHYVRWAEIRMPRPSDDHFRFAQCILGQQAWRWQEQRPLMLAWAVKLFFIPLMYSWLVQSVENLLLFEWRANPTTLVLGLFGFGLCIDLLIGAAGYLFASRLLGNDVRSTDASWLGWLSCVICYPPLLTIFVSISQQRDSLIWSDWLRSSEPLYWLWATLITASWLIYWLATVSFGLRFSNLSWRGLVDTGPYRWSKHPAYLSKNIYWWLHTVPFVGVVDSLDLLRNLLGLSFVSLVYWLRARTEERHLMSFPEYADYATRMERDGLLARCARCCGLKRGSLRGSPPPSSP